MNSYLYRSKMLEQISGMRVPQHNKEKISYQCRSAIFEVQPARSPDLNPFTVELHLSGLIGMASHLDMQKIRIIGFFFENRLHWQFEVRLLIFMIRTCI